MSAEFYSNTPKFMTAVDCIILGFKEKELHLLLTRRPVEPFKNEWSLMGGFMDENESLNEAAKKILYRYTKQKNIYMEQVGAYGEVNRDTGGRVVSVAYYALVRMDAFDISLAQEFDATWINVKELPPLVFDHNMMVEDALTQLRFRVAMKPVIFKFFEDKFTLTALQDLYEAIFQRPTDKRNFRKKMMQMDILNKHAEKDMANSRRGAHYYSFSETKYFDFIEKGNQFSL